MTTRRLVLGGMAASGIMAMGGCNRSRKLDSIAALRERAESGKLTVGFIPYYEISTDQGPAHPPTGFLVDVFKLFAQYARLPLERIKWRSLSWDSFAPLIQQGAVDFSIAGTFITPARQEKVAFTRPLFSLGNGAATRANDARFNDVTDVRQLDRKDIRIAVVAGEQSAEYVRREFTNATILNLDGPDLAAAPRAVKEGRADVAMSDQFILSRYIVENPDLVDRLRNAPFSVLQIAWAVSKENIELLSQINPILDSLVASDAFASLKKAYPVIPFA
ncbi:transporter substrate-binding domain-containing protein [Sphingomonas sp. G-3-2-10]|uniref:substrate-binding periplasmic protein n=1 Tax=Sphingomonas sp. G-3-2-10 TaxID=2728838 RepID=UPI00146EC8AB|nr:transporter substrate-binding domain-containing protein [Sphingomonas sp. G-3-2-10]NML05131.1 amino acid ABC transporter substrate-binding protein [Sphingomonas sp. G-3-2-10]